MSLPIVKAAGMGGGVLAAALGGEAVGLPAWATTAVVALVIWGIQLLISSQVAASRKLSEDLAARLTALEKRPSADTELRSAIASTDAKVSDLTDRFDDSLKQIDARITDEHKERRDSIHSLRNELTPVLRELTNQIARVDERTRR